MARRREPDRANHSTGVDRRHGLKGGTEVGTGDVLAVGEDLLDALGHYRHGVPALHEVQAFCGQVDALAQTVVADLLVPGLGGAGGREGLHHELTFGSWSGEL